MIMTVEPTYTTTHEELKTRERFLGGFLPFFLLLDTGNLCINIMGRGRCTCCGDAYLNRGPWLPEEDELLLAYIKRHGGRGNWRKLPKAAGLLRCGKSCRLRWLNYLRPDLKRGSFSEDEADLIIRLHSLLGNRWALIAGRVPGRSDNEIKNYWNFHLSKKLLSMGINPKTHKPLNNSSYTNIDNTSSGASFNSSSAEKSASPELTWFEQDYNLESTAVSNSSSSDEQQQLRCSSNKFYSRNSSFSSVTSSLSSQSSKRCASPNTPALAEKSMDWTWDSFQNEMVEHNHNLVLSTMQQLEAHLFTDEQGHGGLSDFLQDPGILEGL